jgi:hypothetical protein
MPLARSRCIQVDSRHPADQGIDSFEIRVYMPASGQCESHSSRPSNSMLGLRVAAALDAAATSVERI